MENNYIDVMNFFVETMINDRYRAFDKQRISAKRRGIEWKFTFSEWLNLWIASGRFHLRGSGYGKYVMARNGDKGAYSKENVRIATAVENAREGNIGVANSPETRRKLSAALTGKKLSAEHRRKISAIKKGVRLTSDHRRKIGIANKGKKRSFETRKRISKANERRFGRPTPNPLFMENR